MPRPKTKKKPKLTRDKLARRIHEFYSEVTGLNYPIHVVKYSELDYPNKRNWRYVAMKIMELSNWRD